jgi:hypothetical protein
MPDNGGTRYEQTTQMAVRDFKDATMTRRLKVSNYQLSFRHLKVDLFTDTMFSKVKSVRGNTCAEVYVADNGWIRVFPMKEKKAVPETLDFLFQRHGVPRSITVDDAPEQMGGDFKKKCLKAGVHHKAIEPYSPWLNKAESGVRELKRLYTRLMQRKNAPRRLWDVCLQFAAELRCHTALDIISLNGDVLRGHA